MKENENSEEKEKSSGEEEEAEEEEVEEAWLRRESVEIRVVAGDNPPSLSLPVIVIAKHSLQILSQPLVSLNIASLPSKGNCLQTRNIVLPNPLPFGVLLFQRANRSRSSVQSHNAVFLHDSPPSCWVRSAHWLSLVDNCGGAQQQRPVDDERVADHPPDVARRKIDIPLFDSHDVLHCPGQGHCGPPGVPYDSLRLPTCPRGIENVQRVGPFNRNTLAFLSHLHQRMVVEVSPDYYGVRSQLLPLDNDGLHLDLSADDGLVNQPFVIHCPVWL